MLTSLMNENKKLKDFSCPKGYEKSFTFFFWKKDAFVMFNALWTYEIFSEWNKYFDDLVG